MANSDVLKAIKDLKAELQADNQKIREEMSTAIQAAVAAAMQPFDDRLKRCETAFEQFEARLKALEDGQTVSDRRGRDQLEPDRKRARSADPQMTDSKAKQMIRLSGYPRNLTREERKADITKHYTRIMGVDALPNDMEIRVFGRYGKDSALFFASSDDAIFFFRKATAQGDVHPMYGDTKLYWSKYKVGRALVRHRGTSKACRAFHECGVFGKIENDKGKGEIYVNCASVARVIVEPDGTAKLTFLDSEIAGSMKIDKEAIRARFASLLTVAE